MQLYSRGAASKKNDEIMGANNATRKFDIGCDEDGRNNGLTKWVLKANLLVVAVVSMVVVTLLSVSHVDNRSTRLHADAVSSSKKIELPVAVTSDVRWGFTTQGNRHAEVFKFAVAIKGSDEAKSGCTGSLLARNKVLTAGHCCLEVEGQIVVAGTHNVKSNSAGYQSLKIKRTATPDKFGIYMMKGDEHSFSDHTFIRDICVITLDGDFDVGRDRIIRLGGTPRQQEPVRFAGWGYYNALRVIPWDMHWGRGKVVDCTHIRPKQIPLRDEVICVLGDNMEINDPERASPCKGDSGGPLVNVFEDRLYGVLVDGLGRIDDLEPGKTGCFGGGAWWTSVVPYFDWIQEQMQDAHLCSLSLKTESDLWTGSIPMSVDDDDSQCPYAWKLISSSSSEAIHFAQCGMDTLPKAQHMTYKFGQVFVAARQTVGTTVNMRISAIIFRQKIVVPQPGKVVPVSVLMEVSEKKPHCGLKKLIGMYDGLPLNETSLATVGSHHHDVHFHVANPSGWRKVSSTLHMEAQSAGKFAAKKMSTCAFEAVRDPQYQVMSNGFRFHMTVMVKNPSTGKTVPCTAEVHATVHVDYHLVKGQCFTGQGC